MNRIPSRTALVLVCSIFCVTLAQGQSSSPTPEEAKKFIESAEQQLFDLSNKAQRAAWVQENFITVDTEQIAADLGEQADTAATRYAKEAHRFDHVQLSPELARKRLLLETRGRFPRAR